MRLTQVAIACVTAASLWAPRASAGTQGQNNFGPWPDLGPVGNGRRLFLAYNCSQCHGNGATGSGRAPDISGGESLDGVYNAVMRGEPYGGMPSFAAYFDMKDIRDLHAYLNNFNNPNQPTWTAWWQPHPKF